MNECNADLDHPCDADDGEACSSCKADEAYWRREYARTPESMRRLERMTKEELDQELRDAGRSHLIQVVNT